MVLNWVNMRWTVSHRTLIAISIVSIVAFSLRELGPFHSFYQPHAQNVAVRPFEINLVDSDAILDPPPRPVAGPESVPAPASDKTHAKGKHIRTPNGLLVVNPHGAHPIFELMRDAEAAWEAKRARASKTLEEAVVEYKRRYKRAPPRGFDKWWDYVVKHHVQLPDEYDEIFDDIEPFWGIDPAELARTQKELEAKPGLVTVAKTDARLEIVRSTLQPDTQHLETTTTNILALIRDVETDLPPMRITFSPFDNPEMVSDWRIKTMALEAAANEKTLTSADLPQDRAVGWYQACPPDSPARLNPLDLPSLSDTPPLPPRFPKTFIASHRDAMDPCKNPSLLTTHGQFLSHNKGPVVKHTLIPRFSLCATLLHHDIRPPVPYGWNWDADGDPYREANVEEVGDDGAFVGDLPWDHKVDQRLGWRGRTTGIYASPTTLWAYGQRARFVTLTNTLEGNVSMVPVPERGQEAVAVGDPQEVRLAWANPAWMDVAFTEGPIACEMETCDKMAALWEFRRIQNRQEEGRYKFIFDIDGNGWSGRFKRLITSNALIFKATVYPEWYTSRIAPWVHYVPIQVSYADLYDAVGFFRKHDELAVRIAKAGQEWSRLFWRREDMTAYLYRLLLEYARVTSLDRALMDYEG